MRRADDGALCTVVKLLMAKPLSNQVGAAGSGAAGTHRDVNESSHDRTGMSFGNQSTIHQGQSGGGVTDAEEGPIIPRIGESADREVAADESTRGGRTNLRFIRGGSVRQHQSGSSGSQANKRPVIRPGARHRA